MATLGRVTSENKVPQPATQRIKRPKGPNPHDPVAGHGHSIPLGRVARIPVRLHWSFSLLVALIVLVDWHSGASAIAIGLVWIIALFTSVVIHEIAHCLVARQRGGVVLDIVLFPLGGLSRLKTMPTRPNDELAVALAGPLTSLGIGVLLIAAGALAGAHVWPPTLFVGNWWARLGWLNLLLGVFNLLPALPMDGGRVLRAILARHRSHLDATLLAGRIARFIGVAMMFVGLFYDIWLILIGIFVLMGTRAEEGAARNPLAREDHAVDPRADVIG